MGQMRQRCVDALLHFAHLIMSIRWVLQRRGAQRVVPAKCIDFITKIVVVGVLANMAQSTKMVAFK